MSQPAIPDPEHAFDACPYSRSNDPVTCGVELALASVCELLEATGFKDAAWSLARAAYNPPYVTSISDTARTWARRGGMEAYRIHRRQMIRDLAALDAEHREEERAGMEDPRTYPPESWRAEEES